VLGAVHGLLIGILLGSFNLLWFNCIH